MFTQNMEDFFNCIKIDKIHFSQCYVMKNFNGMKLSKCSLYYPKNEPEPNSTFSFLLNERNITSLVKPSQKLWSNSSVRLSIEYWTASLQDNYFDWNHFTTNFDPIDFKDPKINISLPQFQNKEKYSGQVIIETLYGEKLFKGELSNGKILGQVHHELIDHPGWRTRITIGLLDDQSLAFEVPFDTETRVNLRTFPNSHLAIHYQF